jgi:hypothetical protein
MLGCISILTVVAVSLGAGLGKFSVWWILLPALFAGSFALSNGPSFDVVIRANHEGRLGVFPKVLAYHMLAPVGLAGAI